MSRNDFKTKLNAALAESEKMKPIRAQQAAEKLIQTKKEAWVTYRQNLREWQSDLGDYRKYPTVNAYRAAKPKEPNFPEPRG